MFCMQKVGRRENPSVKIGHVQVKIKKSNARKQNNKVAKLPISHLTMEMTGQRHDVTRWSRAAMRRQRGHALSAAQEQGSLAWPEGANAAIGVPG